MRIVVVSDSHGSKLRLERFACYCRAEKPDLLFHLGDIVEDARWLQKNLEQPVHYVAGNCDYFTRCSREERICQEGKRLLLVHGDRYGVKYGYERLSYYAEENMMDCVLFGHTHRPFAGYVGRVMLVNPGALKDGSFCLLELSQGHVVPRICNLDQWWEERAKKGENGL